MENQLRPQSSSNVGSRVTSVYSAGDSPRVPNFMYQSSRDSSIALREASEIDSAFRSSERRASPRTKIPTYAPEPPRHQSPYPGFREPELRRKKRNRACCCCCRTRLGALCCALMMVGLILGLALATFFLWPRIPNIQLHSITQQGTSTSIQNSSFSNLFKSTPDNTLQANVQINLIVTNPNYINLVITSLKLTGGLHSSAINIPEFLTGGISRSISLIAQKKSPFNIPVQLAFPSNHATALVSLAQVCAEKQEISIPYTIKLSLALLTWTGYQPSVSDTYSFPCPWTITAM
ncbi:hypothetical protein DSO57_1028562 [Entomophthora muscae]|uniref:Uncharacterized protein n=1 Tax=Entomophthora muscae TaxID=34485 RepID=A0ACC2RG33_9FUNG|nr:hypothetical protein DSO57_1028562 [Entomophthora muscae]